MKFWFTVHFDLDYEHLQTCILNFLVMCIYNKYTKNARTNIQICGIFSRNFHIPCSNLGHHHKQITHHIQNTPTEGIKNPIKVAYGGKHLCDSNAQ